MPTGKNTAIYGHMYGLPHECVFQPACSLTRTKNERHRRDSEV
jgi:hypothetical protein